LKRIGRPDSGRFLSERAKDAADDLRLAIKIDQTLFDEPRQFQVAIKLKHLLRHELRLARAR
jgi:hypothetical protein